MYAKPPMLQTNTYLPCAKAKDWHANAKPTRAGDKTSPAKTGNFWKILGVSENFRKVKSFQLFSCNYLEN